MGNSLTKIVDPKILLPILAWNDKDQTVFTDPNHGKTHLIISNSNH
jgi:hypothetical protein